MGTSSTISGKPADLVSFKILANNNALSGESRIVSLEVTKQFNRIASARITMADGDPAKQDFAISSKEDSLLPGSEIEIQLGYHGKSKTVFKGIIARQSLRSNKNKASFLTIDARDKAIQLTLARKNQTFADKKDSEIIEAILKKSGLAGKDIEVEESSLSHAEMVQYNVSDWDFLVSRAEMNSMLVFTDNNRIVIKKPSTEGDPAFEVTFGKDVLEFDSELDGVSQIKEVKGHAWNYKDQKLDESAPGSVKFKENGNTKAESFADAFKVTGYDLYHPGSLKTTELKNWSDARLLKSRMAKSRGRIVIKGLPDINPGQLIKLNGFGKRFNGIVYTTGVRHVYDKSIWETEIRFGLASDWFYQTDDITEKPAAGILPGVNGLQIGIVTKIEGDPDKEDRIRIYLPTVDSKEGLWARVASLDAGKDRGSFFRPEINDEVVVGFLNDDPRHPVILGSLNSSAKPSPFQSKDTNHEKGFITRSKMKFLFDDDKKYIRLETPKGKKIEISDDEDNVTVSDQNNNRIVLNSEGVSIETSKNISFKTSGGDIKLEGLNIELKASVKAAVKGGASGEFSSSGQTVLKGSIVNIN